MSAEPKKSRSLKFTFGLITLIGIIAIVFIRIDTKIRETNRSEAYRNVRSFGCALYSFDDEYGSYPNESTVALVDEVNPGHDYYLSGKSSNAAFRQLMAASITESEHILYAKIKNSIEPDGNISRGEALKKGEVGFSYICGLSSSGNPSTPVVLTPLIPGTTKFDSKPFKGKAVILHINNTVGIYDIHEDGHIYDKGINLLSSKHPIWKGKAPNIRYPE
ncbi:MAG: hypothetical protein V4727_03945 [Verrucomicrobiota bacterium]